MKKNIRRWVGLIAFSCLFTTSVNASVVYDFDVSDTSWANIVSGSFANTIFTFEFKDTANLNTLVDSDLLSMGFDNGTNSATITSLSFYTSNGSINELFGFSGGVAQLIVGNTGVQAAIWGETNDSLYYMQIGQTGNTNMVFRRNDTTPFHNSAHQNQVSGSHVITSGNIPVSVPVPAPIALMGLGLFGLGLNQRRKKA